MIEGGLDYFLSDLLFLLSASLISHYTPSVLHQLTPLRLMLAL